MKRYCGIICYVVLVLQIVIVQPQNTCDEFSPDQSKWAIGYNGTLYTARTIEKQGFTWGLTLSNGTTDSAQYVWTGTEIVSNSFNSPQIYSTLDTSEVGFISTTFGSVAPLDQYLNNSKLLFIAVGIVCERNIKVEACSLFLQDNVIVSIDTNANYLSTGKFDCSNNGVLFNNNGEELIDKETTCLSDVTWKGQDGLQCWKAPSVAILSPNISPSDGKVLENSQIHLTCNYDEVLPAANFSRYFVNGQWFSDSPANSLATLEVKRDMKYISCQAITPFTEIYKETGRSQNITIDVLYQPYETSISADTSKSIVMTDSGLLLNSTQTVTLHCTSDSNPKANCSFDALFTKWSESCSINRDFTTSGSVSCSTNNGIGNTGKSQTLSVVVVEQRTSDVILDLRDEVSVQSGYDVTLNCSVPCQDDLNTIFEWTIPSDRTIEVTDSILTLNNLTRFDRGNYICQTKDDFGTSMKSSFLDVLYGASQDPGSKTACTWSEVANNSCFLNFNSNPPTKEYLLTNEGEDATCQNCNFESIGSENVTQRFIFALSQTSNEAANFNLRILSSGFPDLVVTFAISDVVPIDSGDDQTVVIIASVIGGIVFIAIILTAMFVINRKGFFDKKGKQLSETTSNKNQQVDDGGYEQFQQPAKNLNIDQGTVQTTGHYMNVAFRQTDGHEYDTDIPSANGTYEVPLKEEHKYAEIRNRKGSYETTILP